MNNVEWTRAEWLATQQKYDGDTIPVRETERIKIILLARLVDSVNSLANIVAKKGK